MINNGATQRSLPLIFLEKLKLWLFTDYYIHRLKFMTLFGLTEYLTVPTCNFVSTNANDRLKQALLTT